jgi:cystathionine gamma-synthase
LARRQTFYHDESTLIMARTKSPETIAASNGVGMDKGHGAVTPPLYLSSTYTFAGFDRMRDYDYTRAGNPSRTLLADTLAKLEGGAGAIVLASGMAAVNLVLEMLSPGDLVIAPHDCYGGTYRLLVGRAAKGQFKVAFVDQTDADGLGKALQERPALVLVETPSNPLMRIVDIHAVATRAKEAGAKVAVDNTFLSPALQRPISLGADFVIHSTTKYLNGHSDVVGGAVIAAEPRDAEELAAWATTTGVSGSPFDAYLTLRGLRTLFPRMARQQQTAAVIAAYLNTHEKVAAVHYPGLPTHPGHEIARTQQTGFGAMLSFELAGDLDDVCRFVEAAEGFTLAESLGGVESLMAHPVTMTHASMDEAARRVAGIGEGLLRLSVGLESEEDLLDGLECGFAALR